MTRFLAAFAALALAQPLAAAAQVRPGDLQRGLVAEYALDGDAVDAVTHTRAAPVATRPVEGRDGTRGGALWFDGARSAVKLGAALQPARFTISAWVRPDASDRVMVIVSKIRNLPGHYQKNLELRLDPGGRLFLHVPSGQGWEAVTGNRPVPAGRWTHVAATYDGARAQLYVDGAPDGQPLAVRYQQTATETWIGARPEGGNPPGPTFFFLGAIDDLRIWDRALSPVEIAADLSRPGRGAPPPAPPPGPVAGAGDEAVPLAIYPLSGDGTEALRGANATLAGTKPAEDRAGNPRGALAFAGRDHVDLGVRTEPEQLSLAVWVRPTKANREQVIFSKLSSAARGRDKWLELRVDPFGRVAVRFPNDNPFQNAVSTQRKLATARWTHVAATYDGERAAIYLDGALAGEARVAPFEGSRGPAFLGARPDANGKRAKLAPLFDGRMEDFRIFRGALGAEDVLALARTEEPPPPPPPGRGGYDDDDVPNLLLLVADRSLLRYDAACIRGDAHRIGKMEEKIVAELEEGLRATRPDRDVTERVRYVIRELQGGRGRNDPMALDRKRSAIHALSEALWTELAGEMDEQPRPYPAAYPGGQPGPKERRQDDRDDRW